MLDLVDQTGQPGPAFWQHGRYLPGEEDLPVVGVSWYEAQACARWMGKRLPTDAEWVKAACWPVATDGTAMIQRRFPWGDGLDRSRANLWGSGPNRVVAVTEFPSGASVGGIYQMVGNVWEWNANDFRLGPNQTYGARAAEEHPRRGLRHLLRQPGHLPVRKRRISLEPAAQYRLPLRHRHVRPRAGPAADAHDGQAGANRPMPSGCRTDQMRGRPRMTRGALQPMKSTTWPSRHCPSRAMYARPRIPATPSIAAAAARRWPWPIRPWGKRQRPKMVAVLGPSGSGKTVYLGTLMDMLSRRPQRLQIVARGPFSIGLQQTTVSAFARCEFPAKTGTEPECWNWMHCEIHPLRPRRGIFAVRARNAVLRRLVRAPREGPAPPPRTTSRMELVMPDMAGEAISKKSNTRRHFFVVRSLLRNSAAAMC